MNVCFSQKSAEESVACNCLSRFKFYFFIAGECRTKANISEKYPFQQMKVVKKEQTLFGIYQINQKIDTLRNH